MVLARPGFEGAHSDWREQIKHCFRTLRDVCLRHPRMAPLLEAAGVLPAAVFVPMEVTLRALDQVGLVSQDALRTLFHAGKLHASLGVISIASPFPDLEPSEKIRVEGYGAIERLDAIADWDFDAAFEFGLALIIGGVEAVARTAKKRPWTGAAITLFKKQCGRGRLSHDSLKTRGGVAAPTPQQSRSSDRRALAYWPRPRFPNSFRSTARRHQTSHYRRLG